MQINTRILVFAGSVRTGSFSAKLAAAAAKEIALIADSEATLISLADYPLPIYDGDLEAEKGVPENATKLAKLIATHQGVFIATPEYNNSLPPLLKNAIDWVSRLKPSQDLPFGQKVYGLGSTSPGRYGGARALLDLRKVLVTAVSAVVIPARVEVPSAQHAFNDAGELIDEPNIRSLRATTKQLVDIARKIAD